MLTDLSKITSVAGDKNESGTWTSSPSTVCNEAEHLLRGEGSSFGRG